MTSREQYPWLQQSRTLLIDAYWPPLNPELDYDAEKLVATAKRLNADTVRFGTIGKYALINNPFVPTHPRLKGRDLLAETVEACRRHDMKVVAYVPVGHGLPRSLLTDLRPDWGLMMDDGSLQDGVRHFGGESVAPVCTFGAYRDDILAFIRLVTDNYAIDGLYLDGPYYNWNMGTLKAVCQCGFCKRAYAEDTGTQLPSNHEFLRKENTEDGVRNIFADWVGRRLYELLSDIIHIAKRDKQLPVMFNAISAASRPARWEEKMLSAADGFLLEADMAGLRGLGRGEFLDKIIWRYTQPHGAWPRLSSPYVENRNRQSGYETLTWGGTPIVSYAGRLLQDDACTTPVASLFKFMKDHAEILKGTSQVPFVGIVTEQRIMNCPPGAAAGLTGAYRMFQRMGVPVSVVVNGALSCPENIRRYPLLYLPGDVHLNDGQIEVLKDYMVSGGVLIVSAPTGAVSGALCLDDWFGISPAEPPDEVDELRFNGRFWDIYLNEARDSGMLPATDFRWIKNNDESECHAWFVRGNGKRIAPAIVCRRHGYGVGCHIAFPLERIYDEFAEDGLVGILEHLFEHIGTDAAPARVECDRNLYSSLRSRPGLKLLYLCNPSPESRHFNVGFRVRTEGKAREVRDLMTGNELDFNCQHGHVQVDDFIFTDFACIAINYEEE